MKKYGDRILAILLAAVCLIGVLPLSVYAAYETVYVPPLAALTPGTRPSYSGGGIVEAAPYKSYTVPLPLDISQGVQIIFDEAITLDVILLLDLDFKLIGNASQASSTTYNFTSSQLAGGAFLLFGTAKSTPSDGTIIVNNVEVEVVEGPQNLAHRERYEQIEVPDTPSPPSDTNIANDILTMWQQFLVQNLEALGLFYEELVVPIALIIGIPICIAIIGIILILIGGKKR